MKSEHEVIMMANISRELVNSARNENLIYLQGHLNGKIQMLYELEIISYKEALAAKAYLAATAKPRGMTTILSI